MKTLQKAISVNGEDKSMSFPDDFRANLSAWQESEKVRLIIVTSGRKCLEPFDRCDPVGLLVRMFLESPVWFNPVTNLTWKVKELNKVRITRKRYAKNPLSLKPSAEILKVKDIPSKRLLYRLVPSVRRTAGIVSGSLPDTTRKEITTSPEKREVPHLENLIEKSLLPTPVASDATAGSIISEKDRYFVTSTGMPRKVNQRGTEGSVGLGRLVKLLPTPNASEALKYTRKFNPGSQMGTSLTALALNNMLPTPQARDWKGMQGRGYKGISSDLPTVICKAVGKTSQLNPLFVAQMMGFPPDWTVGPFQSGE